MEKCSENRTAYLEGNRLEFDSVFVHRLVFPGFQHCMRNSGAHLPFVAATLSSHLEVTSSTTRFHCKETGLGLIRSLVKIAYACGLHHVQQAVPLVITTWMQRWPCAYDAGLGYRSQFWYESCFLTVILSCFQCKFWPILRVVGETGQPS